MAEIPRSLLANLRVSKFSDIGDQLDEDFRQHLASLEQPAPSPLPEPNPSWLNPLPMPRAVTPQPPAIVLPDWSNLSFLGSPEPGRHRPDRWRDRSAVPIDVWASPSCCRGSVSAV